MDHQAVDEETSRLIITSGDINSNVLRLKSKKEPLDSPNIGTCIKTLILASLRSILFCLSSYILMTISYHFVSKLGNHTLVGAVGLGNSWLNITSVAVIVALNSGTNVFISQAHGAKNRQLIMVYFYKALILRLTNIIPSTLLILASFQFFKIFGVEARIAQEASIYCVYSIGTIIAIAVYDTLKCFVIGQGIFTPVLLIQMFVTGMHWHWCSLFVIELGLGIKGVALALTLSQMTNATLLFLYIASNAHLSPGFFSPPKESKSDLSAHFKGEAFVGAFVYLEWAARELCTFASGSFQHHEIASLVITNNIMSMMFMISIGVNICLTIYIGKSFGEKNVTKAKLFMRAGFILDCILIMAELVFALGLRVPFFSIYGKHTEAFPETKRLFFLYLVIFPADFLQGTMTAIMKGAGLEKIGSKIYIFSYYVVGLPVAFTLGVSRKFQASGIWIGLGAGIYCMLILSSLLVYQTDFKRQGDQVVKRLAMQIENTDNNTAKKNLSGTRSKHDNSNEGIIDLKE